MPGASHNTFVDDRSSDLRLEFSELCLVKEYTLNCIQIFHMNSGYLPSFSHAGLSLVGPCCSVFVLGSSGDRQVIEREDWAVEMISAQLRRWHRRRRLKVYLRDGASRRVGEGSPKLRCIPQPRRPCVPQGPKVLSFQEPTMVELFSLSIWSSALGPLRGYRGKMASRKAVHAD